MTRNGKWFNVASVSRLYKHNALIVQMAKHLGEWQLKLSY